MDSLFDVLNSRNLHNKGFKSPLNAENWPEKLHFLEATKTYLLSLRSSDGRFLYQTKEHTAITGFLINIESLIALVPQLLMVQQFVLTYKFSQDHLELLFNAVRRAGGWNNNPNVKQFQATFKKILVRCGVQPGKTGNVSLLDSSDLTTPPLANSEIVMSEALFADDQSFLSEHDYCSNFNINYKYTIEQIVSYIAGWVVRKAMNVVNCSTCRVSLVCVEKPTDFSLSYHLLNIKNKGGLIIPSNGTVSVLLSAEKAIRHRMKINSVKMCRYEEVLYIVKKDLGTTDIFELGGHILEIQSGIDNHYFNLITVLVNIYFNMRQHHIAKMYNIQQHATVVRQKLSKLILV
ncbi:DNA transposase THAP9 isoform X3 [Biomphalaria glabrata]|nr:DNA transposase THAP9 isoform X3 [Biomphalaria glabrata]